MAERANRPTEAEVRGLTVDQLAEGARRLKAVDGASPSKRDIDRLQSWLLFNADALISAAQRAAAVEGCVREIVQAFDVNVKKLREMNPGGLGAILTLSMTAQAEASLLLVRDLAARHNIDLSEPTTEPPVGQQEGGDCPVQ